MPRTRATTPPPPHPKQNANQLLAALPPEDYARLRPELATVAMKLKQILWEPNRPIEAVYFPIDAVSSILALTDGHTVEVGTIGNEGFVGLPVFLGATTSPGRAMVQVAGQGERLDIAVFRREAHREGRLRQLLERYTQAFMTQVSQSTACNRAHSVQQRLARWLLIVRDRVKRNEFPLTHEFLGQMLGVRRATVSETAAALQRLKLIGYHRGVITIRNGRGLERAACECYGIVRQEFERLLGIESG
ncbi:MAG TPA: Crp/Fnr family transcriptional regulator [Gemmatimonadales bacterium]|nr:Crp/Fnr family transcriptional regulator [Gemmatimonadales bacterium]